MSSNISVLKICELCKNEFIARTTVTKCCSDNCAKRLYKLKLKITKVEHVELKKEIKQTPKAVITEDQIKVINNNQYLTLREAAFMLNISPLTIPRWTLCGKIRASKI